MPTPRRLMIALAAVAIFAGPATAQEGVGMRLESAGFVMRPANTPQKMERLRTLPAHKFVARRKAGTPYYIYADPTYCRCAYVGGQQAMNSYRDMVSPPRLAPGVRDFEGAPSGSGASLESEMIRDMEDDGAPAGEEDLFHPGF
jgi:hypothetical protein